MEIFLDISRSQTGRLTGTARAGPADERIRFSGTLELVAALERLADVAPGVATSSGSDEPRRT